VGGHLLGAAESSDETTDAHEGDHKGLDDRHPFLAAVLGRTGGESVLEVGEEKHGGDLTGIVAEQKTADGGGDAEDNSLDATVGAIDADGPGSTLLVTCCLIE
jgi:hypothetical protein